MNGSTIAIIGVLVPLIHSMFPALFPALGKFLKDLKWYIWVISLLILTNIGQYFLFKEGIL